MPLIADVRTEWHHQHPKTRKCAQILRNAKIFAGSLCFAHNGRVMPAQSLDNENTIATGGPLIVAGATSPGDLRIIAKVPNVKLTIVNGAALAVTANYAPSTTTGKFWDLRVTAVIGTTTASAVVNAIRAHALANSLVDITYVGLATSTDGNVSAQTVTDVPHVEILGICMRGYDNTDSPSADVTLPTQANEFAYGEVWMNNDGTISATVAADVPGQCAIVDDASVSQYFLPLRLTARTIEVSPFKGVCISI